MSVPARSFPRLGGACALDNAVEVPPSFTPPSSSSSSSMYRFFVVNDAKTALTRPA